MDSFKSKLHIESGRRGFSEPGLPTAPRGPQSFTGSGLVVVLPLLCKDLMRFLLSVCVGHWWV